MKGRRRNFLWVDALIAIALLAVTIGAIIRWPDEIIADLAIPIAISIALGLWRR
jgi:hypothetical protein